ncbi:Skb1 methyltransferase [Hortaea werneckii]|uniref:Protein arginine N-methyltransferase n=1 Tax=Hortaea werneckii TaxID=91943 RepID=A0A3M7I2U7_HORWE|nr:Skb1 methyltransferase [Hortaea werneckii]KAI6977152.1 Skb1 methyltransferase [Hortaea werneckii]KAI7075398.1 Skb1 methyltransferase [Hortaea werneckii]KAI7133690.1 Skb1 methyltransferase [Hortaea werneckii]KAI7441886.1 Skb1 methyltransferase [Hortaea werneckii]
MSSSLNAESSSFATVDDIPPSLYIGHHATDRSGPVTTRLLAQAQNAGYDLLTSPITTPHFHSRVLQLVGDHFQNAASTQTPVENLPTPLITPLSPADSHLTPSDANSAIIGVVSPWIDLSSRDPLIAHVSKHILGMEVAYAAFCGISNLIIHGPVSSEGTMQYARAVLEALGMGPYVQIHVLLPMTGELEVDVEGTPLAELARDEYSANASDDDGEDVGDEGEPELYGSWEVWDAMRGLCSYHGRLSIALELPRQLPPIHLQSRWYSEPVRLLVFPRTSFLRNPKGWPVLSKAHQSYLSRFLRLRFPPWALLSDCNPMPTQETLSATANTPEPTPAEASSASSSTTASAAEKPTAHLEYLRHLQQTQPYRPPIERFGQGYQDFLQSPLQPLTDNLESITYEVFEKDPVKYEWYERAIALALEDLEPQVPGKGQDGKAVVTVAVVGAGRGPLVSRALEASRKTGVQVKVWAVEKNTNAYVLLQRRNMEDPAWNGKVSVVKSDMRSWKGPTAGSPSTGGGEGETTRKVDILVSELLGSFADNELSPECLDGVQHVLHPTHGVSIPQSYSAHLTPLASPRIHADLLSRASNDLNMSVQEKWELPYVVMLHQYDFLSTSPPSSTRTTPQGNAAEDSDLQPNIHQTWSFTHPLPPSILSQARQRSGGQIDAGGFQGGNGSNEHNARCTPPGGLTFPIPHRGTVHGLVGYFETVLYASPSATTNVVGSGKSQSDDWKQTRKVELSTNPLTMSSKSPDMISWFPIFFPFKTPLYVPDNGSLEVRMWRGTDDRGVWYEWCGEVFEQRVGGGGKGKEMSGRRGRKVGGSGLLSSRGNMCLM